MGRKRGNYERDRAQWGGREGIMRETGHSGEEERGWEK